jgi:tetratricopeptide (TPR) repeat protein
MPGSGLADMSEKKKTAAPKSLERRLKTKATAAPDTVQAAASEGDGSVVVARAQASQLQLRSFETAMKLFHARKLPEARVSFEMAVNGPERDVAQRARLHISMCDRRLQQLAPTLGSAEDNYNYAVALLNVKNVSEARQYLEKAVELAPGADHIHYALAAAKALTGDAAGAAEHLRRAIEIEPRNRVIARQDVDFAQLANQPPFDSLLYPEKKSW